MKKITLILGMLLTANAVAFMGGGSTIGPANPAAVNCIKLGGDLQSYTTPAGENAYCLIEEWQLFREMDRRGLTKNHTYPGVGMPNPAAVNCKDVQGSLVIKQSPQGEAGYCAVEQWTLIRVIDVTAENN